MAFADAENAKIAERLMPMLLRIQIGLDPQGDLRRRLWNKVVIPALEKNQDLSVVNLALRSWKEAPGDNHDAQALANALGQAVMLKADASVNLNLLFYVPQLMPHLDQASAQSLGDVLLKALALKRGESATALAKCLVDLLPRLTDDQKRRAASDLVSILIRERKERSFSLKLGIEPILPFWDYVDPGQYTVVAEIVVGSMTEGRPFSRIGLSYADAQGKKKPNVLQQLDTKLSGMLTRMVGKASAQETQSDRLVQLTRILAQLDPETDKALRQQVIGKAADALSQEKDPFWHPPGGLTRRRCLRAEPGAGPACHHQIAPSHSGCSGRAQSNVVERTVVGPGAVERLAATRRGPPCRLPDSRGNAISRSIRFVLS